MDNAVSRCISVPEINSILSNLSSAVNIQKDYRFWSENQILIYWKSAFNNT